MILRISLAPGALRRIDDRAAALGHSRFAYLVRFTERVALQRAPLSVVLRRLDRLFATQPTADATTAIRAQRDAR